MNLTRKVLEALFDISYQSVRFSKFLLSLYGFLLALGFLFGSLQSSNFVLVANTLPQMLWALFALSYGTMKAFSIHSKSYIFNGFAVVGGLWLWSCMFISFLSDGQLTPTELLFFIPLLLEMVILSMLVHEKGHPHGCRT